MSKYEVEYVNLLKQLGLMGEAARSVLMFDL